MDILRPIVRHVTAPLYARRDGYSYRSYRKSLEESQWLSSSALREAQTSRLQDLIEFAYKNNAFHRERMSKLGVLPSDIQDVDDLAALPTLTKDDIRAAGVSLFSDGYTMENTLHTRTGVSTGVPLHVYVDHEAMNWKYAATWRHNSWAGWSAGDKVAAVWGDTDKGFRWKSWLRFRLEHRMIFLDTLKFSNERLRRFHQEIVRYRPTVMMGHAHSVYQFARFCLEHELRFPPLSGVVTTVSSRLQ